ncbi:HD domain-containing protein [Arcobacteraceae bacterium]|nr:HD domain-containing protein [Arcobacteraceae bacterium]
MPIHIFQKLTQNLSIKQIVIAGVVIMAFVIGIFSATMIYFTSTVKFDKETLRTIITLEEQNHAILKNVRIINDLNTEILLNNSIQEIKKIKLPNIEDEYQHLTEILNNQKNYNKKIDLLHTLIQKKLMIQKELYQNKLNSLQNEESLNLYIENMQQNILNIQIITEKIAGQVVLKNKRKLKSLNNTDISKTLFNKRNLIYKEIEEIQSLTKNLYTHILKIPILLNDIILTDDLYKINHLDKNIIFQENYLIATIYQNLISNDDFYNNYQPDLHKFNTYFGSIKKTQGLIIDLKKNAIINNKTLDNLINEKNQLEQIVFIEINKMDEISKNIKFSILNKSDTTAQKITYIVISVSIIFSILLIISAIILIARINVPLDFITKFIKEIGSKSKTLSSKLPVGIDDEFGQLSNSFNNMTSTIEKNITKIEDLYIEIENTQKEIIFTMGAAGELRSKETGQHVKRVAEYSKLLALLYGLDEKEAELIKLASPMHDIGKVGIPDAILHKPGKLDSDEFKIMKTHAQLGYNMLKSSDRIILKSASIVAHQHHEKYNGKGYPQGLKGEGIHIFGRITAVADVFDALGSERAYKKAWPDQKILDLFKEEKGEHFDPQLIDLFIDNKKKFYKIRDMYKEEV